MTPEGAERLDRRSEVLNEALAKEVETDVRRREEAWSAGGEWAVPREPKNLPISLDSDSGSDRRVKDGCRGRRERRAQKFDRTEHQAKNRDQNINAGVTNG